MAGHILNRLPELRRLLRYVPLLREAGTERNMEHLHTRNRLRNRNGTCGTLSAYNLR